MIKMIQRRICKIIGNMKIASKIRLCMLAIDVILTILICIFTGNYFNKLYYGEVEMQMQDTMNVISSSLVSLYDTLLTNVISFASTSPIQSVAVSAKIGETAENPLDVQSQLIALLRSNTMIDSVFLVNQDGTYYTIYSYAVRPGNNLSHFLDPYGDIRGITWLPNCHSPFLQHQDVIPVVVPLSTISPGDNVVIADKDMEASTRLVVLLNLQNFQNRLSLSNANYFDRSYLVVNAEGENISLENPETMEAVLKNPDFLKGAAENKKDRQIREIADLPDNVAYSQGLPFSGLQLIGVLSKESLNAKIAAMNRFIILMGIAGLIFAAVLSRLLSNFVTRPLNRLMGSIRLIQENRYDVPYELRYNDEIGQLNNAVNSMHDTIQKQFTQIKKDEHEKYQLEIQLLAEQINPHLLYNTLEGINLEILNNHTLLASSMINNLGTFMRIGLNCGDELIMMKNEIAHVEAYVNIMNHRNNKGIVFSSNVENGLNNHRILKMILQPLVENSIKHGFHHGDGDGSILIPSVEIHCTRESGNIRIEVADNGVGIDMDRAREAMYREAKESEHHIGLHNVYTRLKIYYGKADIEFQTIPFYRNSVIIWIPDKG